MLLLLTLWTVSAAAAPAKSCDALLEQVAKNNSDPKLIGRAYAICGDGHGLLARQGSLLVQTKPESAAELFAQEIRKPGASPLALRLMTEVIPKLSPDSQKKYSALGSTKAEPAHMPNFRYVNDWILKVACRGTDLRASRSYWAGGNEGIVGYTFECPKDVQRTLYVITDAPPLELPAAAVSGKNPREVDAVLAGLNGSFGIRTAAELRAALLKTDHLNRNDARLMNSVEDSPGLIDVWGSIVENDPNDLEAVLNKSGHQAALGDYEGSLATLRRTSPDTAVLRDTLGAALHPSALVSRQCYLLQVLGRLDEAAAACDRSLALGSTYSGKWFKAMLLYRQGGAHEQALKFLEEAIAENGRQPSIYFLKGLLLAELGRDDEAKEWWVYAIDLAGVHPPSQKAVWGEKKSRKDWLAEDAANDSVNKAASLRWCVQIYLDLDVPQRAQRCGAAADKLMPGFGVAGYVWHATRLDEAAGLKLAKELAPLNLNPAYLANVGDMLIQLGNLPEALRWAAAGVDRDESSTYARFTALRVCKKLKDPWCLRNYREKFTGARPWEE